MSICILWQEETDVKGATNANSTRLIYLGWKSNLCTSCLLFLPFKNRQKSLIRLKMRSQRKPSLQIQCSHYQKLEAIGCWVMDLNAVFNLPERTMKTIQILSFLDGNQTYDRRIDSVRWDPTPPRRRPPWQRVFI